MPANDSLLEYVPVPDATTILFYEAFSAWDFFQLCGHAAGLVGKSELSPAVQEVLSAGLQKTGGLFRNLTKTTANTATRQFENALDLAITGKKGKSVKAVKALLDVDALKASKNQRDDIDAALEALKKDDGYLFDEDNNTPPPYAGGTGRRQNPNGDMTLRSALSEKFSKKG